MTQDEFMELNPCIAKAVNGGKLTQRDMLCQRKFFESHTFAFNLLPERWADVLKFRYGFYDGNIHTCEEIGKLYNLTRARISHIENEALKKLAEGEFIQLLMKYDDSLIEDSLIKDLISVHSENYKRLMVQCVRKALLTGELCVVDNANILDLKVLNKKYFAPLISKKLTSKGIDTIEGLLVYMYQNKNYAEPTFSKQYFDKIILTAVIRTIEEGKLKFVSEEMKLNYLFNKNRYLSLLNDRNEFDVVLFPEHEQIVAQRKLEAKQKISQEQQLKRQHIVALIQESIQIANTDAEHAFGNELSNVPIEELNFSLRTYNAFRRAGVATVKDLLEYYYSNKTFIAIRTFGKAMEQEVNVKLQAIGVSLPDFNEIQLIKG